MIGLVAASGSVFALMTIVVAQHPAPFAIDQAAAIIAADLQTDRLTLLMKVGSELGSTLGIATQIAVLAVALLVTRRALAGYRLVVQAAVGAWVGSHLFKALLDRPRPGPGLVEASGASFPSGHATQGGAYFLALATVLAATVPGRWRVPAATLAVFTGVLSSVSRVYLDVHWLTDVVAGYMLGVCWFASLLLLTRTRPGSEREVR